jgi:hypothetical protein
MLFIIVVYRRVLFAATAVFSTHGVSPARSWLAVQRLFSTVIRSGDSNRRPLSAKPTYQDQSGELMSNEVGADSARASLIARTPPTPSLAVMR